MATKKGITGLFWQFKKGHIPWNKGKTDFVSSERMRKNNPMKRIEVQQKSSISHKEKVFSIEVRLKMREAAKRVIREGRHNFYIDGRTSVNKTLRHSIDYKIWRLKVYQRDNFTCQLCNQSKSNELEAHHIKSWAKYPNLRFDVDNGITFCKKCHKLTDSYPKQFLVK